MRSKGDEGCVCVCVFSQQLHDWGRMEVEGHQGSSLTVVLFQQEVMSQVNVENVVVGPRGR